MPLRDWLLLSRDRLVADLNTDDIIDRLARPGLISAAEEAEIDRLETRQAKVRRLVRLIALRDSEELLASFHTALKADYPWLTTLPDSIPSEATLSQSSRDFEIGVDGAIAIPQLVACSKIQTLPSANPQMNSAFQIQPLVPSFMTGASEVPNELVINFLPISGSSGVENVASGGRPIRCLSEIPQAQPIRSDPLRSGRESADFGSPATHPLTHAHIDLVASNVIALDSWRGIARDLGVTEDDIASVQSRVPLDLRAQCKEILRVWTVDYEGACLSVLVSVLRKNRLNRLAARLESTRLPDSHLELY